MLKNFYYDDLQLKNQKIGIIETRLLIKKADEWQGLTYIWNSEEAEAVIEITGGSRLVSIIDK